MNYFEKNLTLLEKRQPDLAEYMRGEIDTRHIEVITSETGMPTAGVTAPEGQKVFLHDLKDPVAKAKEHAEKLILIGNDASVLLGFGLGYLALEIEKSMEDGHLLIICETDPALFKVALEQIDLGPVMESESVKILIGKEIDIATHLTNIAVKFVTSNISVIKSHPAYALDPHTYSALEKKAQETSVVIRVNANTLLGGGREMAGNTLANTPTIIRSAGVKELSGKLKNIPAIIVGAGPSLDKNVHLLKGIRKNAVVIAVDRALGLLLPLGFVPHLVPSIDFSVINYDEKYAPLQIDEKLFLVFSQTVHQRIAKTFAGPKFVMHMSSNLSSTLAYYWGDKGSISTGLHVGHLAFCLARDMGCNPIIMVGMDLAYTEDKIHAEDLETKAPGYTPTERFAVEGIFGEPIKSDAAFRSFVANLNDEIKATDALCIDATEGGAKKEGTHIMRLRDAIDEYCRDEHPRIQKVLAAQSLQVDPVKYDQLLEDLQSAIETSKEMKKASESTLKIIKKLRKMKKEGQEGSPEYIKLSQKAEKMTIEAGGKGRIMAMLENYNFSNILFMKTHETKKIDKLDDQYEKLDKQMDRAETYYKKFINALNHFINDTGLLLKKLTVDRNAQETLKKSSKMWSDYLKYGLELIKIENYMDAEGAFKKVIELKPDYCDAYYHLGRIYNEQNRFASAMQMLEQAAKLKTNFTKAKSLLKKCQEKHHNWHQRCKDLQDKYLKDPSKGRDEKEILLEGGNFYFRAKDYTQAEKEYLKVIDRNPTLPEAYYHLGHTYFAMKDFDKGVEALSKATEIDPENPVIYRDLGLVSIDRGLVESAEKFFLKAIELTPDDLSLKELLGNIYLNNKRFDKAIILYEDILKSQPRHQKVINSLSSAYQAQMKSSLQPSDG